MGILSSVLLGIVIISSNPQKSNHDDCAVFGLSSPNRYEGSIYVCLADVADDPVWADPTSDLVPLPLHDAIRRALGAVQAFDASEKGWTLDEVTLTPVFEGHWVYRVDWTVPDRDKEISYLITMSGKVLSPEITAVHPPNLVRPPCK